MKSTLIIIQARLGSSRLPRKVIKKLGPWTPLEILTGRLLKFFPKEDICFAIPESKNDDELMQLITEFGFKVVRGSENDVYARFCKVLETYPTKSFVRITADCPLISPKHLKEGLELFNSQNLLTLHTGPKIAEGLDFEILNTDLFLSLSEKNLSPLQREHPTLYIYQNKNIHSVYDMNPSGQTDDSIFRVTLDEVADHLLLEKIVHHFQQRIFECSWEEIKEYLTTHPDVYNLNTFIKRNEGLELDKNKLN